MAASPEIQKLIDEDRPKAVKMMQDEFSAMLNKYGIYISSFNCVDTPGETTIELKLINK